MIPKVIHYCWLSNDPIPEKLQKCMESWKRHLPDYEFMLWNFDRFDKKSSLWVEQAFDHKKYAFAADYIRLYAVYHYGGIYLDMDVEVVKSFDPLLTGGYILGYETPEGIEAGILGGEKGAPWLKKCLDYYDGRGFIKKDGRFDEKPLPKIMYDCLEEERKSFNIYPNEYFTAKSYVTGIVAKTNHTYTIHHFAGSWLTEEQQYALKMTRVLRWFPSKTWRGHLIAFITALRYRGFINACKEIAKWCKQHREL